MGNIICVVSCGGREAPGTMRSQAEQGEWHRTPDPDGGARCPQHSHRGSLRGSSSALRDEVNDKRANEGLTEVKERHAELTLENQTGFTQKTHGILKQRNLVDSYKVSTAFWVSFTPEQKQNFLSFPSCKFLDTTYERMQRKTTSHITWTS